MDMKSYLAVFDRTLVSGGFNFVDPEWLHSVLRGRVVLNRTVDAIKKAIFYGRESPLLTTTDDGIHQRGEAESQEELNYLHAALGIDTESAEILELMLYPDNYTEEEFRAKVLDEGGDLLWYLALLFKTAGVTFEQAAERNIQKLAARYPEGFSELRAIHRNEAAESAVFH